MQLRLFAIIIIALPAMTGPAAAKGDAPCSCQNLESLQQEVKNAGYEAMFFADMAARLKAIEHKQIEANKDPANPDNGLSVMAKSGTARQAIIQKEFRLPEKVKDYTGPASVDMAFGTCRQPQADLDALAQGSSCKAIADATLKHEATHRALCEKMTPAKYWARLPSEIAEEEAGRYQEQARDLREALKKVIDNGTIKVKARMTQRLTAPQFDVTYDYVTEPFDLSGKSSPGSDKWTLKGEGRQTGKITKAVLAGRNCTPSGALLDSTMVELHTDGFSMSGTATLRSKPGNVTLKCGPGSAMSLRPDNESGSGELFKNLPFQLNTTRTQNVTNLTHAKIIQSGGISVSGTDEVTIELTCPAN